MNTRAEELFKGEQEYVSKVAKTEKDICALLDFSSTQTENMSKHALTHLND